jgi:hypothetical protein
MTQEEAEAAAIAIAEEKAKKVRKRPDSTVQAEPGDNTKFTQHTMNLLMLDPVDLTSPEQVKARILEYFDICQKDDMKPSVADFSCALGISRKTLWDIVNGRLVKPDAVTDLLKRTHYALNAQLENYAMNGKVNPVTFIFLAKNHFSYTDKQEITVSASNSDAETPEQLAAKYADVIPADFEEND